MSRTLLLILVVVLTIAGPRNAQAQRTGYKAMANDILMYVNEHRKDMRLAPLQMNDIVSATAEQHSRNMASERIAFGHDGFDARMNKLTKQIKPVNAWAENVAYSSENAKEVVEMWLHSAGHKKNIEGKYNTTGIGIAKGKDGTLYFTQIFLNKS